MVKKIPPLTIVIGNAPIRQPARTLGEHGAKLWRTVLEEYQIEDCGGLEMLTQACAALDRAERLRAAIDDDGEVVRLRTGPKSHPALRDELANRAFVVRTLARLGLDVEAVRGVGRPGGKGYMG